MSIKIHHLLLGTATALTLGACSSGHNVNAIGGQFWQRVSVSEAIYQQGPKAQQMLNRDISRCVTELRELEGLGTIKNAIPADVNGRVLDPDEKVMADWDSPERDKHLFAEHSDYADFESCMAEKGWERVEHVPFDVARKGRENYLRAKADYKPEDTQDLYAPQKRGVQNTVEQYPGDDYDHVNE